MVMVYQVIQNKIAGCWCFGLEARYHSPILKKTFITDTMKRKTKSEILITPDESMNLIYFAYNRLRLLHRSF